MVKRLKIKSREPSLSAEAHDTVRRGILSVLERGPRSAKEISGEMGISEKEVYEHLEHIRKTADHSGRRLIITPAECRKCGFTFRKRERLKTPGRCPVCRSEAIHDPLFSLEERNSR